MLNIKIKKLNESAVIPSYSKNGDAGMDLTAVSKDYDGNGNSIYGTGLALEIPDGYVGLLFPRSSSTKKDLILGNSVGVIDSGYRGEIILIFKKNMNVNKFENAIKSREKFISLDEYEIGERVGQIIIMPYPKVAFFEVDDLGCSERGAGGFGSTGK